MIDIDLNPERKVYVNQVDATAPHEQRAILPTRPPHKDESRGLWPVDTLWPKRLLGTIDTNSCDEGTALFLEGIVKMIRPRIVFETGTHTGRSTHALASGLVQNQLGHLWTLDMQDYGIFDEAIPEYMQPYITRMVGKSPEVLDQMPEDLNGIELAYIDGGHEREVLEAELEFVEQHRAKECWALVHDSRNPGWPAVRQVMDDYIKHPWISCFGLVGLDLIWMRDD